MCIFGCKHKRLSEIKPDGYQYCLECNKAIKPVAEDSDHILEDTGEGSIEHISTYLGTPYGSPSVHSVVQQRCKKCGQRFTYDKTVGGYQKGDPNDSWCRL